jgi:hypothetical protein
MPWIASVLAVFAALCWYLSAPQQRLLKAATGRGWRYLGLAAAVVAMALWIACLDSMSGIVSVLTAIMFGAVALPFVAWWLRPAAPQGHR